MYMYAYREIYTDIVICYTCTHIYLYMYIYMHIHICIYIYLYVYVYTYIYTVADTHAHDTTDSQTYKGTQLAIIRCLTHECARQATIPASHSLLQADGELAVDLLLRCQQILSGPIGPLRFLT